MAKVRHHFNQTTSFISVSREIVLALLKVFDHNSFSCHVLFPYNSLTSDRTGTFSSMHTRLAETLYFPRLSVGEVILPHFPCDGFKDLSEDKIFCKQFTQCHWAHVKSWPDHWNSLLWHFWQQTPNLKHICVCTICPRQSPNDWAVQGILSCTAAFMLYYLKRSIISLPDQVSLTFIIYEGSTYKGKSPNRKFEEFKAWTWKRTKQHLIWGYLILASLQTHPQSPLGDRQRDAGR